MSPEDGAESGDDGAAVYDDNAGSGDDAAASPDHGANPDDGGRGRVVVVGSANVDLVVPVPRHPGGGETVLGGELTRHAGGKGANQAVAAARAGGAETSFVGALGRDDSAELLLTSLTRAGVRTDLVERVDAATGTALISVSPDGENTIIVAPGANSHVRVGQAQAERVARADVVLAQLEVPLAAITAAAAARRPGALLVLNAAPSRELPREVWDAVDVLVVNEHEAADLAGRTAELDAPAAEAGARASELAQHAANQGAQAPDGQSGVDGTQAAGAESAVKAGALAADLLAHVPAVVVTLGAEGSLVTERGRKPVHVAAFPVSPVDTTGAGDTYCGVLAAALARGAGLPEAARLAAAAGALATTGAGAQEAVPTADAVAELAGR